MKSIGAINALYPMPATVDKSLKNEPEIMKSYDTGG